MGLIKFNTGGVFSGTAGTSQPLEVTIEGETFSTAYNSTAAQTVTDFVAEHAQDIADRYGMLAVADTADIQLWGAQYALISTNGTSDSTDLTKELDKNTATLETISYGSSAKQVVFNFSGATSSDVVTVDTASEADASRLRQEVEKAVSKGRPSIVARAHKAVAS